MRTPLVDQYHTVATTSQGLLQNNAHLNTFLNAQTIMHTTRKADLKRCDAIIAWGNKPSARKAKKIAAQVGLPLIRLEDGFLRSLDGGIASKHAASMVVDEQGIYFDLTETSRLEQLILSQSLSKQQTDRVTALIQQITTDELSKYNLAPQGQLDSTTQQNILIVDQTYGDQSVVGAGATKKQFKRMLSAALRDYPDATIWIKTHPQSSAKRGKPSGYFAHTKQTRRIRKISTPHNPIHLLKQMDAVYVVSSHMGFEALMLGKTVHCFGVPWYAGWGLTCDKAAPQRLLRQVISRRGHVHRSLHALFHAAYIEYSRYVNPATAARCDLESVLRWLSTNRKWQQKLAGQLTYVRASAWKLTFMDEFFDFPQVQRDIKYFRLGQPQQNKDTAAIAWGYKKAALAHQHYTKVWCMEDGFVRSRGLGAALIAPLSIVMDKQGIYYDSTKPSDLESLLNKVSLNTHQQQRTQNIISQLLTRNVSKYNVGSTNDWPNLPSNKKIILVPGQVENDASVQLSQSAVKTNLTFLQAVRQHEPTAFVIYKPHPDVLSELRPGLVAHDDAMRFADVILGNVSMPECLTKVHEVHTISSLTGFEALLRGVSVTCYGLPFYAGWGLTTDRVTSPRRQRSLTLTELVYTALISYPMYKLPLGKGLAEIEDVIDFLSNNSRIPSDKRNAQRIMQLHHRFSSFVSRFFEA